MPSSDSSSVLPTPHPSFPTGSEAPPTLTPPLTPSSSSSSPSSSPPFSLSEFNNGSAIIEFDVIEFSSLTPGCSYDGPRFIVQDMYFWIHVSIASVPEVGRKGPGRRKMIRMLSFWLMSKPRVPASPADADKWFCYAVTDFQMLPSDGDQDFLINWRTSELFCHGSEACGYEEFEQVDQIMREEWRHKYLVGDILHLRVIMSNVTSFRLRDERSSVIQQKYSFDNKPVGFTGHVRHQLDAHEAFGREEGSDFTFVSVCKQEFVKNEDGSNRTTKVTFPLHSHILSPRCSSFGKIFHKLRLLDQRFLQAVAFEYDALTEVLSYLYRFEFHLDPGRIPEYLRIVRKLRIDPLRILLSRNIDSDNCLFIISDCMRDPGLLPDETMDAALTYLQSNTSDVLRKVMKAGAKMTTAKMKQVLSKDLVKKILVNPHLSCREILLYQFVMHWIRVISLDCESPSHEQMRDLLKDDVYNIRFTSMTSDEFTNGPAREDLLTSEEKLAIFMKISTDVHVPNFLFATSPRPGGAPDPPPPASPAASMRTRKRKHSSSNE